MRVVKLGGSLSHSNALLTCLTTLENKSQPCVIVPGGGGFVDQVRRSQQQWQFNDETAHKMALLGMQQMALLIQGIKQHFLIAETIDSIHSAVNQQKTVIWSPNSDSLSAAGVSESWDVSSDSLAAWLATRLKAEELVIVKSAAVDKRDDLKTLTDKKIIDKAFCQLDQVCYFAPVMIELVFKIFL